jgi:hypothetical protein
VILGPGDQEEGNWGGYVRLSDARFYLCLGKEGRGKVIGSCLISVGGSLRWPTKVIIPHGYDMDTRRARDITPLLSSLWDDFNADLG